MAYAIDVSKHSPNYGSRGGSAIRLIVLHASVGNAASSLVWLCDPKSKVSSHYLIAKDGHIWHLVADTAEAWHAGKSGWRNIPDVNKYSIGIELENKNNGRDLYPDAQVNALKWLTLRLVDDHPTITDVVTHAEIAVPKGRKSDPKGFGMTAFHAWFAALALPPARVHGTILTNIASLALLRNYLLAGHYTALKVVTRWGLSTYWTDNDRRMVAGMVPNLIVRTAAGDPSSGAIFLYSEEVLIELASWLDLHPTAWIELGNEPNSNNTVGAWEYRYHLIRSIAAIRARWPHARIIAPAILLDRENASWWVNVCADVFSQCDAIGVHVYAYRSLNADDTGQQHAARLLYARFTKPLALTEYGINDGQMSKAAKGTAYAAFVKSLPPQYTLATSYHIDQAAPAGTNNAYYHLPIEAHVAYGNAM